MSSYSNQPVYLPVRYGYGVESVVALHTTHLVSSVCWGKKNNEKITIVTNSFFLLTTTTMTRWSFSVSKQHHCCPLNVDRPLPVEISTILEDQGWELCSQHPFLFCFLYCLLYFIFEYRTFYKRSVLKSALFLLVFFTIGTIGRQQWRILDCYHVTSLLSLGSCDVTFERFLWLCKVKYATP